MKTTHDSEFRSDDLGPRLSAWMASTAPTREPAELVGSAVGRMLSIRQRPAFLVRTGLPGSRFALPILSPSMKLVFLAALLLVAVGAAAAVGARLFAPPATIELTSRTYEGVVNPVGRLATPRSEPAAVRLLDGRVLIVGEDGIPFAEVYDARSGVSLPVTGGSAVGVPSLALMSDGRVLVIGWLYGPTAGTGHGVAQVYDPRTNALHEVGPMTAQRMGPAVASLADGRVLVAGGLAGETGGLMASAELFDPRTETFSSTGTMPAPRSEDFATLLDDGRVLITRRCARANDCEGNGDGRPLLYDPRTETFARADPMVGTAGLVAPVRLGDGRVLLTGPGVDLCGRHGIDPSSAEIFDPSTDTFAAAPPIPHKATTVTALLDGRVLLTGNWSASGPPPGGCNETNTDQTTHGWMGIYDPATGDVQLSTDPYTGDRGLDVEVDRGGFGAAVRLQDGRVLLIDAWDYTDDGPIEAPSIFE